MIEMYDVGRVLIKPFDDGYRFIAEQGKNYISDSNVLERIIQFHRDRSRKLDQEAFDSLNKAWVQAIREGRLLVNPHEIVYADVNPRFDSVKRRGDRILLHTSGSKDLIELLLKDECQYDELMVGSEIGDKNNPETFAGIWDYTEGGLIAFFDDKPSVLNAAYNGFRLARGKPRLYLVDRLGIVDNDKVKELKSKGIGKISSLIGI